MPDVDEAFSLSAQHLQGRTVTSDSVLTFQIGDGEQLVEIGHEIGDPEVAARRFDEVASEMHRHAERVRLEARRSVTWT